MKPTQRLHDLGQSLWLDNITRRMLDDGTLAGYIDDLNVTGLTSNPSIFQKAIAGSEAYDQAIRASGADSDEDLFFELALDDLRRAADLFAGVHERTAGGDGWVSLEVSPLLADAAEATIAAAAELYRRAGRDNLFIKIPGTAAGLEAIEASIFAGVPINVTLLFSRGQTLAAAEAWMRGIERRIEAGLDPQVTSVLSLFVSRWDVAVAGRIPAALEHKLGIAVAGETYAAYLDLCKTPRWQKLAGHGVRPQRLLWASTGTKDPAASDTLYVEALAAPDTIITLPDKTLRAFADHGRLSGPMAQEGREARATLAAFADAGIDLAALAARLQREGADKFSASWNALLGDLHGKRRRLGRASGG
ncbi:MAG TPA: transaldolase [Thiohalobacter sp.]|nr:transaldolase [Thiohalobacter sp.]